MTRSLLLLVASALLVLPACERDATVTTTPNGSRLVLPAGTDPIDFDLGTVRFVVGEDTVPFTVEIAEDDAQRGRGLMFRTRMPRDAGMIFLYPEGSETGFYMFNTRIPLSIAFTDRRGRVLRVLDMEPCGAVIPGQCPTYRPGVVYHAAVELNQSEFERHGIRPGHYLLFERAPDGTD